MNKKLISLPSGIIINLANVAYIEPSNSKTIDVIFNATYSVNESPQPLTLRLDAHDSTDLLRNLSGNQVTITYLRDKIRAPENT